MADGRLRTLISSGIERVHWQAIETGSTGRGIPDLNGCDYNTGIEVWIECKKTDHWAVEIMPEQVGWLEQRARAGGRTFVAVRRADSELWLLATGAARVLATPRLGLKNVPEVLRLGVWAGGARKWPWPTIRGLIFPVNP